MFVLFARAFAATPCPPPDGPPAGLTPDGAAHLLVRARDTACWWIVDDQGDARVGARWDRALREPLALVPLADGRAVAIVYDRERGAWSARVYTEEEGGRRVGPALPARPDALVADPDLPRVALAWGAGTLVTVWVVDVDTGERLGRYEGSGPANEVAFTTLTRGGRPGAPR